MRFDDAAHLLLQEPHGRGSSHSSGSSHVVGSRIQPAASFLTMKENALEAFLRACRHHCAGSLMWRYVPQGYLSSQRSSAYTKLYSASRPHGTVCKMLLGMQMVPSYCLCEDTKVILSRDMERERLLARLVVCRVSSNWILGRRLLTLSGTDFAIMVDARLKITHIGGRAAERTIRGALCPAEFHLCDMYGHQSKDNNHRNTRHVSGAHLLMQPDRCTMCVARMERQWSPLRQSSKS